MPVESRDHHTRFRERQEREDEEARWKTRWLIYEEKKRAWLNAWMKYESLKAKDTDARWTEYRNMKGRSREHREEEYRGFDFAPADYTDYEQSSPRGAWQWRGRDAGKTKVRSPPTGSQTSIDPQGCVHC